MLDLNIILSIIVLLILLILFLSQSYYKNKISKLQANLTKTTSDKISLSTKYGQISEEFSHWSKAIHTTQKILNF